MINILVLSYIWNILTPIYVKTSQDVLKSLQKNLSCCPVLDHELFLIVMRNMSGRNPNACYYHFLDYYSVIFVNKLLIEREFQHFRRIMLLLIYLNLQISYLSFSSKFSVCTKFRHLMCKLWYSNFAVSSYCVRSV